MYEGQSIQVSKLDGPNGTVYAELTFNSKTETFSGKVPKTESGSLSVDVVATDANQNVIADDDRRGRGSVVELRIGNLHAPALFARSRVEADEMTYPAHIILRFRPLRHRRLLR